MYFTAKFVSDAKQAGVLTNTKEMILAYWAINVPAIVRESPYWVDEAEEATEEFLDDHPDVTITQISDFVSSLVEAHKGACRDAHAN